MILEKEVTKVYAVNKNGTEFLLATETSDTNLSTTITYDKEYAIKIVLADTTVWWYNNTENKLYPVFQNNADYFQLITANSNVLLLDLSLNNWLEDTDKPTISIIDDVHHFGDLDFSVEFSISDVQEGELTLEIISPSSTLLSYTSSTVGLLQNINYKDALLRIDIIPNTNTLQGIVDFEIKVTDSSANTSSQSFKVFIENKQYHVITESVSLEAYNALTSTNITDKSNLYAFNSYNDYTNNTIAQVSTYERFTMQANKIVIDNYIIDIQGEVTHTTNEVNTTDTFKFEAPLNNLQTSILYSENNNSFNFIDLNSTSQKVYIKSANGDINSFVFLNKEAKNEMYKSLSANPKIKKSLNNGYTYISLSSLKSLCDEDIQSFVNSCDKQNTLESVFGSNSAVESVFIFGREWMYWDTNQGANSASTFQKFTAISPLNGVLVKTLSSTDVYLPFNEDSEIYNDYTNLFSSGWTLMSNNKTQTVQEIEASLLLQNKELVYILVLREGAWKIYAPTNNELVDASIQRLKKVKRYESYWVDFK